MARGINKVTLIGNLGNDPEVKYMPSGGAVSNVSIAIDESYKDKNTGNLVEKVEWVRLVFFNRLGEIAGEYLKKGSKVYIEGSLRTRKWEKDGVDHYTTEVVVSEMRMLDGKQADGAAPAGNNTQRQQAPVNNATKQQPAHQQQPAGFDSFDDDIPF